MKRFNDEYADNHPKKKICFVSLYAYSLFNSATAHIFGGSEVRGHLFGNGLAALPGNEVSFIVFDHGQRAGEKFGEVTVYPHSFYRNEGHDRQGDKAAFNIVLGRIANRLRRLFSSPVEIGRKNALDPRKTRIYDNINADLFCTFGVSDFTFELAEYCRSRRKKLVLFLGGTEDLSPRYYPGSPAINSYGSHGCLCYEAIKTADIIIAQTEEQRRLLQERFQRPSTVVRNPIVFTAADFSQELPQKREYILWVGKSDTVKQPDILLQIAAACPEARFLMVMNRADPAIYTAIQTNKPSNVDIIDFVPKEKMDGIFARSKLFINTSKSEGFANTFLQAGKYGVPIVSLNVDPDDFITANRCGFAAHGDLEALQDEVRRLLADPGHWAGCANNCRNYVWENHRADSVISLLNETLSEFWGEANATQ